LFRSGLAPRWSADGLQRRPSARCFVDATRGIVPPRAGRLAPHCPVGPTPTAGSIVDTRLPVLPRSCRPHRGGPPPCRAGELGETERTYSSESKRAGSRGSITGIS
jgi:hypothetical protein